VTIYVQIHIKFRYDKNHTFLLFNIGDTAFLNLHQDYRVSGIHNKKLAQQWIESFRIIYRISFLIYELEFPNNINIYPIISIIHLKLASKNNDSYNRSRNDYPTPIKKSIKQRRKKIAEIRNWKIYESPLKTIRPKQKNY
jgi:hypothetical protein